MRNWLGSLSITALAVSGLAQVPDYVPTTGLVAWYPFNGNANDVSGHGNNGNISGGVTSTSDRFGMANSAFFFDGTSGYIAVPSLNNMPYSPISYSAWVIVNSYFPSPVPGHKFRTIVGRHTGFVLDCGALGFYADGNVAGGAYDNTFIWWRGGGVSGDDPYSASLPAINAWVHIVFTQTASGNFKFYTNGTLTNSGTFTDAQNYFDFFRIGASNNNTNGNTSWNDKLDDIGIWDRVLSAAEVTNLYQAQGPQPPSYVPTTDLIAWYPFNGNANDESGHGHHGVTSGAILSTDRFGVSNASYDFDGINDFINCGNITEMNGRSELTISAWVNAESNVFYSRILGKEQNGNSTQGIDLQFATNSGTAFRMNVRTGGDAGAVTNDQVSLAQWHHIAAVFNGAGAADQDRLKIFVNGVQQALSFTNSIPATTSVNSFECWIGGISPSASESPWNGKLDDIGIWSRALTPAEVQGLFTSQTCQQLSLSISTDNNGAQTSWQIIPSAGGTALCSGTGYGNNTAITLPCCVPDGCYHLQVFDSFGDGMSSGSIGGWVLRDEANERIIDNAGDGIWTGSLAQVANSFCVPLSDDHLTVGSCDVMAAYNTTVLQAAENTAVTAQYGLSNGTTGYQFWIFDAEGTYSRRVFLSHASPGTGSPIGTPNSLKCTYLRLNSIITNPMPQYKLLNVCVRGRVADVYGNFGPSCRLKVDPTANCLYTQLTTIADPDISCGSVDVDVPGGTLHATEAIGATRYQFQFSRPGYLRNIASTSRSLTIGSWFTLPLQCGLTYNVRVRISFDDGVNYCPFGPVCSISTTSCSPFSNGNLHFALQTENGPVVHFWPNPNRSRLLNITIDEIATEVESLHIEITDMLGQKCYGTAIEAGPAFSAVLDLDGIAAGTYVVSMSVGSFIHTSRLVLE